MKIAITGGAGFIGSHLAKAYLNAGHDVLIIDSLVNGARQTVDSRARFYQMDIRDRKLLSLLQMERPDIMSHHAVQRVYGTLPLTELSLTDADVHVRGLLNVLDSCVAASVSKIIFASGGNTLYGRLGSEHMLVTEDAPLCPQRPLDISKVAGEYYVQYYTRHYGLSHTILRYADVYGETESDLAQHPLSFFVRMLLEGRRPIIRGAVDEIHDHIFIEDVVRANLQALEYGCNQTVHISSGQGYTLMQFYRAATNLLETSIEPTYISNSLVEASSCVLDNALAWRVLGWRPEIDFSLGVQWAIERLLKQQVVISPVETSHAVDQFIAPSLVGVR